MRRIVRFGFILALIVTSFYAGSALAGMRSTPRYIFPLEATMTATHNCVKVGHDYTYSAKLVNTSGRTVGIRVPFDGMYSDTYGFTYVSSNPSITTVVHTGQNNDGSTYNWYERYWLLRIKPGATRLLSITGTALDWNVVPANAPPDYTPEPWPQYIGFSIYLPGKDYAPHLGFTTPYCGLKPPPVGGGK